MEGFQGMACLHTKTVEEMCAQKEEARKNAQAAGKGDDDLECVICILSNKSPGCL